MAQKQADQGYTAGGMAKSPVEGSQQNTGPGGTFVNIFDNWQKRAIFICENSLICNFKIMRQSIKLISFVLIAICLIATGCSSSKKGMCGCPNQQGMVGYK